ncbi:PH domain-containing protein [Actinomyces sp. MRS3W]|uniref:PH domain-containing protein n=1 Tax=Actinomyces sp. MRS3W TaxID=2800796 RepID=UPI0028FD5EDB|nr:PH domain-containing protein [Actinomyces sp. MRS3W]MDU0348989.1 PH domain-containing protein [Actinomyces sp. MRS3W]
MPTIILRSLAGRIGTVLVALACLYPVMVIWLADGYGNGLKAMAVAAVVVLAVWLLWWRPQAVIAEDAIGVRNAFRSHRIPWESLRGTRTRWGLVLEVGPAPETGAGESEADTGAEIAAPGAAAETESAATSTEPVTPTMGITVTACQRGGLFTAIRHERRAVHVDEAYVTATVTDPSASSTSARRRTYRTHMDGVDAAHLIELYQAARTEHLALTRRLRRRAQRLGKLPAESVAASDGGPTPTGRDVDGSAQGSGPTARWDRAPLFITAAVLILLAAALILL